jgi:uncharacterized damage-inducible protein DinB
MKIPVVRTAVLACCFLPMGLSAQQSNAPAARPRFPQGPATITSVIDTQLTITEYEVVATADAMPEDKYGFAPTAGEFKGVRTFAQEVKHIATVNNRFFGGILGETAETPASQYEAENGPDSIQTKAQIMQYLKDSFAKGHKAIATINLENAFVPLKNPATPFLTTSSGTAIFACAHAMDHYGQMVEYLRDNGIVPPMSRQRPPANPSSKSGN